jgi:hypothetical protein
VNDDAVCTNIDCYQAKARAQFEADAAAAEVSVVPDDEARKLYAHGHLAYHSGLVELDGNAPWELERRHVTWKEALGTKLPPVVWAWVPGRGKVELARADDVKAIVEPMLRGQRSAEKKARANDPSAQRQRQQQAEAKRRGEIRTTTNRRAMAEAVKAWPNRPPRELLVDLALAAIQGAWADTQADVVRVLGLDKDRNKQAGASGYKHGHTELLLAHVKTLRTARELMGFVACVLLCRGLAWSHAEEPVARLKRFCSRVRVNYAAIEREVTKILDKPTSSKHSAATKPTTSSKKAKTASKQPATRKPTASSQKAKGKKSGKVAVLHPATTPQRRAKRALPAAA